MDVRADPLERNQLLIDLRTIALWIEKVLANQFAVDGWTMRKSHVGSALRSMLEHRLAGLTPGVELLTEAVPAEPSARFWVLGLTRSPVNGGKPVSPCCVTLALIEHDRPVAGVIVRPIDTLRLWAVGGVGAVRNDLLVQRHEEPKSIEGAKISIARWPGGRGTWRHTVNAQHALETSLRHARSLVVAEGTPSVDLARLAGHEIEGVVAFSNRPWEVAAGAVIARETGAVVVDREGSPYSTRSEVTIAAAPGVVDQILAALALPSGYGGSRANGNGRANGSGPNHAGAAAKPLEGPQNAEAPLAEEPPAPDAPAERQEPEVPREPEPSPGPPEPNLDVPEGTDSSPDRWRLDLFLEWTAGPVVDAATDGARAAASNLTLKAVNRLAMQISIEDPGSIARPLEVAANLLLYVDDWTEEKAERLVVLTLRLFDVPEDVAKVAAAVAVAVLFRPIADAVQVAALLLRAFGWTLEILAELQPRMADPSDAAVPIVRSPQSDWDLVLGLAAKDHTDLCRVRGLLFQLEPTDWPTVRNLAVAMEPVDWWSVRSLALRLEPVDWRAVRDLLLGQDDAGRRVVADLARSPDAAAVDWTVAGPLLFGKEKQGEPIAPAAAIETEVIAWRKAHDAFAANGSRPPTGGSAPPTSGPHPPTDGGSPPSNGSGPPPSWTEACDQLIEALARLRIQRLRQADILLDELQECRQAEHPQAFRGWSGVGVGQEVRLPPIRSWAAEWYGMDPHFWSVLEEKWPVDGFEGDIGPFATPGSVPEGIIYRFGALDVPGDPARHDVAIVFWRQLPQPWAEGIDPRDYPSVYTSRHRGRYHDNRDDGLCMWSPFDPPEQRWSHDKGLLTLIEITRRHLFLELHRQCSGGDAGGQWLGAEAPHGLPPEIAERYE
jgi:myo-inositol-1(or 4)-monophosphatase